VTERLYLGDAYLARFEAEVVSARDRGGRPAVILDRSAFYPEGGGQPADRGTLGGIPVVDVREEDGEVLHLLGGPAPSGRVLGEVDWRRRFDHMQQHHGQHLLSAAFERLYGARTVSFHLGEELCTIDLDRAPSRIGPAELRGAESAANEAVWRDLPVAAREHSPEELARLPLRKEAVKGSRVVVVSAGGPGGGEVVDASPCGGTHPRRTGEVGAVAVLRAHRWGEGTRVEFACGARVLRLLHEAAERLSRASGALRCAPAEVPAGVERLLEESASRRKEAERLVEALAAAEASRLAEAPPGPVVARLEPPLSAPAGLRAAAQALATRGRTALLGGVEGGRAHLCFARPRGPGPNLGEALRRAAGEVGGKGGGSAELAQGSGPEVGALGRALDSARKSVEDPGA
jgi:alanyl-tRNA synthetase